MVNVNPGELKGRVMESTGKIDLHQDDFDARAKLLQDIIDIRTSSGLSRTEISRIRGLAESQFDFEKRFNWRYMTVISTARALGRSFQVNIVGLPEPDETIESIILDSVVGTTPDDTDFISLMRLRSKLVRTRCTMGKSLKSISGYDTQAKTISKWEKSDRDTWISNLQRYTRLLGGHLEFDVSELA